MPKEEHCYKPDSSFDQVMMLYRFDKKLRLLIFNEIEKIEVAVRSAIVNIGSEMTGDSFWMTDESNFADADKFRHTMDLIDAELHRSREEFIVHFKQNYSNPYPPAWILAEVLPFGVIIKYFLNIISPQNDMKAKIDALLVNYPAIDTSAMGFPKGWENEPLWK